MIYLPLTKFKTNLVMVEDIYRRCTIIYIIYISVILTNIIADNHNNNDNI